jgi:hypothetical protein
MLNNNILNDEDLVFYNGGENNIYSGGFSVGSHLMSAGAPPMRSVPIEDAQTKGIFGEMYVVPPMWFLLEQETKGSPDKTMNYKMECHDVDTIEEDLHEKLLQLLQAANKKKRGTAKLLAKSDKKRTKRNK